MIHFDSPILLIASLALAACAAGIAIVRQVDLRPLTRGLILAGLVLLALAAGGAGLELRRPGHVAVMVDVSPSTRTAGYRDGPALRQRIDQLLARTRHAVYEFSADLRPWSPASQLEDWSADRTRYAPPAEADAVLLFSDGRFEHADVLPPTYPVIDAGLDAAHDARVERLEIRTDALVATIRSASQPRELVMSGATQPAVVAGSQVVSAPLAASSGPMEARLAPGDAWPENDGLALYRPPPELREWWWVGGSPLSERWLAIAPADLPSDAAAYLNTSLIVLDNIPADALSRVQQDRLHQYVRDLGGGLILLGGDSAFAAGGYPGTVLELLSPLASTPPEPATHWILLADSSGSMGRLAGSSTRWQLAADALVRVLRSLPPDDLVSIGSFARDLRWWSRGASASQTAHRPLPPTDVAPQGPTNLGPAIESILAGTDGALPTELLLLSDADTQLDAADLAGRLSAKRIRLHLLATAELPPHNPVKRLVEATGGSVLAQSDPRRWAQSLRQLLRAATPDHLDRRPLRIHFAGPLVGLPPRTVQPWNHVWLKQQADPLALADSVDRQVLAGSWRLGGGQVAAMAFAPAAGEAEAVAALVASPPRDPRLAVSWDAGQRLRVSVDAFDAGRWVNNLKLELELLDADDPAQRRESSTIPQVGPGRYELVLPAPRTARLATVRLERRIIAQRALAGRYAPEFDGIGTDHAALRELAQRTGGRVIGPADTNRIDFDWPRRRVDLRAILAILGAAMIALGLVHWKLR